MTFLKKLLWWKRNKPVQRIRVCVECGMPLAEHRDWCSILRTMREHPSLSNLNG
jgi:hypothetical protein